jgi:hypothetical protein
MLVIAGSWNPVVALLYNPGGCLFFSPCPITYNPMFGVHRSVCCDIIAGVGIVMNHERNGMCAYEA